MADIFATNSAISGAAPFPSFSPTAGPEFGAAHLPSKINSYFANLKTAKIAQIATGADCGDKTIYRQLIQNFSAFALREQKLCRLFLELMARKSPLRFSAIILSAIEQLII